jgi:hypothetical protein
MTLSTSAAGDGNDAAAASGSTVPAADPPQADGRARRPVSPAPAGTYWSIEECGWVRRTDLAPKTTEGQGPA